MDLQVRKLILAAEDHLRERVRTSPVVAKMWDIGLQYDLTIEQIGLLLVEYVMNENERLREFEQAPIPPKMPAYMQDELMGKNSPATK